MNVFKILVASAVALTIIYFILTLFVFEEVDPNKVLEENLVLAKNSLGESFCSKISIKKDFELNPLILKNNELFKNQNMELIYYSNNNNLFSKNNFFIAKNSIKEMDFCSICYPSFVFIGNNLITNYDLVCQTIFGSRVPNIANSLYPLENVSQGFFNVNYIGDLPEGYVYEFHIFSNNSEIRYSNINQGFFSSKLHELEDSYVFYNKDNKIEFKTPGEKVLLQFILPENRSLNNFLGPGKILINSINVKQNSEYQMLSCKSTYSEKQYFNFEKQKCVQYNYCEGCILPNQCAKVWQDQGVIAESFNSNYSISYIDGEC